jgi:hypothetical protein
VEQVFTFNFSDPGLDHAQDTLLLPSISYVQATVVYLGGELRTEHSIHSVGGADGATVAVVFSREVRATVHVEARCCTGTLLPAVAPPGAGLGDRSKPASLRAAPSR